MNSNNEKRSYDIGEMVQLAAPPPVRIIGYTVQSEGPGGQNRVTYTIFDGQQLHQGVGEDQIVGVDVEATQKARAEDAERVRQMEEAKARRAAMEAQRGGKLSDAISGAVANGNIGGQTQQDRRQGQAEGYEGPERRADNIGKSVEG